MKAQTPPKTPDPRLGAFQHTYLPRPGARKVLGSAAIFALLLALVAFATAINAYARLDTDSSRYQRDKVTIWGAIGAISLPLALAHAFGYHMQSKYRVDVYDNGLVIVTWRGETPFLWREITAVKKVPIYAQGRYGRRPINWTFTLTRRDGVKASFGGLIGLGVLESTLRRKAETAAFSEK